MPSAKIMEISLILMFTVLFVEACAMRITKIQEHNTKRPVKVLDCFVDSGYVKLEHGSLLMWTTILKAIADKM